MEGDVPPIEAPSVSDNLQPVTNNDATMAAQPKKGMNKGLKITLIVLGVIVVLVIVLAFIAPLLIWNMVIPEIKEGAETSMMCYDAESSLQIVQSSSTCSGASSSSVEIQRGVADVTLKDVEVIWIKGGDSFKETISTLPQMNSKVIHTSSSHKEMAGAVIVPIIEVEGKEITCAASLEVSLAAC